MSRQLSVIIACTALLLIQVSSLDAATPPFVNGRAHTCDDFFLRFLGFVELSVPDPGWVLVQRSDPSTLLGRPASLPKFRSATGVVLTSGVNFTDYPDVHDSHDFTFDLRLDPLLPDFGDIPILSDVGKDSDGDGSPDTLHLEWETGILTNEFRGDGSARFFPKWAWPIEGDRVWANGYWIFDCGHPDPRTGGLDTEIHPIRAIASMRQQVATPPDSTVPIPVTATDLYIHGRAGVVTDILECGQGVILDDRTCPTRLDQLRKGWTQSAETPRGCDTDSSNYPCHDPVRDHMGIPIDENFEFDICTPPQSGSGRTVLKSWVNLGPGNTVTDPALSPILTTVPVGVLSQDPCAEFAPVKVHVKIPLAGSDVTPDDVYAYTIYIGWFESVRLRHFRVRLESMLLIRDNESDFIFDDDCECTFFWMNVDRAPNEWIRLSDFATGNMNDFGDGDTRNFSAGATFDFLVQDGQPFTIRANGYDGGVGEGSTDPTQDCLDEHFGHHDFGAHVDVDLSIVPPFLSFPDICYTRLPTDQGSPENDPFEELQATFGPHNGYGVGRQTLASGPTCIAIIQAPGQQVQERAIPCDPEQQAAALEALRRAGFFVFGVGMRHDYELVVSIEEFPIARPGDLDGDGDVDREDLELLLQDRGKSVSQSACGARCDLDGDGQITGLDARDLILLCSRPNCATQ
jgi:Dockerin type I domain